MKRIMFILSTLVLPFMLTSCRFVKVSDGVSEWTGDTFKDRVEASAEYQTKTISITEFSLLNIEFPAEVKYTTGPASCQIFAPDNVIEHIKVVQDADSGQLVIKGDGTSFKNLKKLEITLSSEKLSWVLISGAAEFEADEPINADEEFRMVLSGASDIDIDGLTAKKVDIQASGAAEINIEDLNCKSFDLNISGAGEAEISGKAEDASVIISGAGEVDLSELVADKVSKRISGAGRIIE